MLKVTDCKLMDKTLKEMKRLLLAVITIACTVLALTVWLVPLHSLGKYSLIASFTTVRWVPFFPSPPFTVEKAE